MSDSSSFPNPPALPQPLPKDLDARTLTSAKEALCPVQRAATGAQPAPNPPKQREIRLGSEQALRLALVGNEGAALQQQGRPKVPPGQPGPSRTQRYSPVDIKITLADPPPQHPAHLDLLLCILTSQNSPGRYGRAESPSLSRTPACRHDDALASITRRRRNKSAGISLSQD